MFITNQQQAVKKKSNSDTVEAEDSVGICMVPKQEHGSIQIFWRGKQWLELDYHSNKKNFSGITKLKSLNIHLTGNDIEWPRDYTPGTQARNLVEQGCYQLVVGYNTIRLITEGRS